MPWGYTFLIWRAPEVPPAGGISGAGYPLIVRAPCAGIRMAPWGFLWSPTRFTAAGVITTKSETDQVLIFLSSSSFLFSHRAKALLLHRVLI